MCGAHFRRNGAPHCPFCEVRGCSRGTSRTCDRDREMACAVRWDTASTLSFPDCAPECFAVPLSLVLSRFGRRERLHSGTRRFRLVSACGSPRSPKVAQPRRFGLVWPQGARGVVGRTVCVIDDRERGAFSGRPYGCRSGRTGWIRSPVAGCHQDPTRRVDLVPVVTMDGYDLGAAEQDSHPVSIVDIR